MKNKYLLLSALLFIFAVFTYSAKSQILSPILETPPNLEEDIQLTPEFSWDNMRGAQFFEVIVYKDNENQSIVNAITVTNTYYDPGLILDPNTAYHWKVRAFSFFSQMEWSDVWEFTTIARGSNKFTNGNTLPRYFSLHQNYPNPFNPVTNIKFELPKESFVKLSVFDITGKTIEVLTEGILSAGTHEVNWNASNVGSGVYFYKMQAGTFNEMRKMIVVK